MQRKTAPLRKPPLSEFANVRKGGIIAINIDEGDALIEAKLTAGTQLDAQGEITVPGDDVVLITREGMSIRFSESDVRSMGRAATGVRGIQLDAGDGVVALAVVVPDYTLLVAGENGIGKRTDFNEYRVQTRGGKGIITMKTNEKTGKVIGALAVKDEDEIMLITVGGQMVRMRVNDVREAGRNTQGVKLIDVEGNDKLQAIAPVIAEEEEAENQDAQAPAATPPPADDSATPGQ